MTREPNHGIVLLATALIIVVSVGYWVTARAQEDPSGAAAIATPQQTATPESRTSRPSRTQDPRGKQTQLMQLYPCRPPQEESSACLKSRMDALQGAVGALAAKLDKLSREQVGPLEEKIYGHQGKADSFQDIWSEIDKIKQRLNKMR